MLARSLVAAAEALTAGADVALAPTWPWQERSSVITDLDRVSTLVGMFRARVLAAHKADGRWATSGDRTFEKHRARVSRVPLAAARAETALGEGLAEVPRAVQAVQAGAVGLAHAEILTRLRTNASPAVRAALEDGGTEELLEMAAGLDVATFAKRAAAWAAAHDVDSADASFEKVRSRRFARSVERDGGVKIDAFVDPIVGASFRTALDALTPVPSADDERTPDQRAADGLAAMATRVLDRGSDKIGAQVRPHISLIVPAETWAAMRQRAEPPVPPSTPDSPDAPARAEAPSAEALDCTQAPTPADAPAEASGPTGPTTNGSTPVPELDDGTPIALSALERIACDCEITRIVLDTDGVPLNVGQTQRTFSKELRRAILTRDGHCRWPGCTVRASWCEIHHIRWYSHGGPTSLANGLALCVFHHHEIHRRRVTITPTTRGHTLTNRDGNRIGTSTRETGIIRMLTPPRPPSVPTTTPATDRDGDRLPVGQPRAGQPPGPAESGACRPGSQAALEEGARSW